ncbi:hypothetical protein [Streptomyces sp. NPDC005955]|uniref:hypothetical protein n=1 Tax=Streptomyces sp. NPDC005955 TaxID=3364738 RepID=UPI003679AD83
MENWREHTQPGQTHDPNEVTVQMDGVGKELGELISESTARARHAAAAPDGPVFVDETGRRSRLYRRIGMAVVIGCAVYACVIVATVVSGNSSAPWLPMPDTQAEPAGKVDTSPDPSASAEPSAPASAPSSASASATAESVAPAADPGPSAGGRTQAPAADPGTATPEASADAPDPEPTGTRSGAPVRPEIGISRPPITGGVREPDATDRPGDGTAPPTASASAPASPSGEPEESPDDDEDGQPLAAPEDARS